MTDNRKQLVDETLRRAEEGLSHPRTEVRALAHALKDSLLEIEGLHRIVRASGERREAAEEREKQLEEALRFYANRESYQYPQEWDEKERRTYYKLSPVLVDEGFYARAALEDKE